MSEGRKSWREEKGRSEREKEVKMKAIFFN